MKYLLVALACTLVVCIVSVHSSPLYQDEEGDIEIVPNQENFERAKRSPGKGQFEIDVNDERDEFGKHDKHVEGRYKQKWGREDGPRAEVDTYYKRNFGRGQPGEQHGVRGKITIPIGDDD